jgi:CMP-N,N'-diacetyllegionaminic acid synthase
VIDGKKVIALIPSRSGSKGLPNKNILDFLGKPLMAWSIEAAKRSRYVDRTILSTDSKEIANQGLIYGAEVPFLRPEEISRDSSTSMEVVKHAIDYVYSQTSEKYEILVLLEPTSPLRTSVDLDQALEKLVMHTDAKSLVSLGQVDSQHSRIQVGISGEGFVKVPPSEKMYKHKRRQDLPKNFFLDGSLYISYIDDLLETETFVQDKTLAVIMPKWKTIEIDDEYDYEMAIFLAKRFLV